jgi:hypothetical protein
VASPVLRRHHIAKTAGVWSLRAIKTLRVGPRLAVEPSAADKGRFAALLGTSDRLPLATRCRTTKQRVLRDVRCADNGPRREKRRQPYSPRAGTRHAAGLRAVGICRRRAPRAYGGTVRSASWPLTPAGATCGPAHAVASSPSTKVAVEKTCRYKDIPLSLAGVDHPGPMVPISTRYGRGFGVTATDDTERPKARSAGGIERPGHGDATGAFARERFVLPRSCSFSRSKRSICACCSLSRL